MEICSNMSQIALLTIRRARTGFGGCALSGNGEGLKARRRSRLAQCGDKKNGHGVSRGNSSTVAFVGLRRRNPLGARINRSVELIVQPDAPDVEVGMATPLKHETSIALSVR